MLSVCLNPLKRYRLIHGIYLNGACRVRSYMSDNCQKINRRFKRRRYFEELFGKYLFLTNVISCGVLMAIGDLIEQELEYIRTERHKDGFDWTRNRDLRIVGCFQGVFIHFFYKVLDAMLPGVAMNMIAKKITLDQSIASPVCLIILFGGLELLGERNYEAFKAQVKEKFATAFGVDCAIWIPAQIINFSLLPPRFRVLYVNFVAVCYNVSMSFIIHG